MKKIFFILMTGLMLLVMSGCGMKEIQNNKAQKLSAEEKAILDLTENGSAKTRSINEICVQEEPLVMRENVYNESGVLVQYFQYEYDQFNRYKTVYNYQKDSDTEEFILFSQDDYSYDDYFYYKTTTYVQNGGLVTQDIYDTHNNWVMAQMPNIKYDDYSTITYTYKYITDTDKTEEEYAYAGESISFSHYTISRFNEQGDKVYSMTQYSDNSVVTSTFSYKYDSNGRIISEHRDYVDEDMYGVDSSVFDVTYKYSERGLLISEEEVYVQDAYSWMSMTYYKTTLYEYDELNRLIKKTTYHKSKSDSSEFDERKNTIEYVYEILQDDVVVNDAEVPEGDDV